jgi:hypothetical protein
LLLLTGVFAALWPDLALAQRIGAPAGIPCAFLERARPMRAEQTPYVPYYGKNRVRWDSFDWYIYESEHFEIYFTPEIEQHLERVTSYAENAYQHIAAALKYDLAERVPIILFKTQSSFQQQNILGAELPEGVLAFAEPEGRRMVLPIDEPPDQLYRLITHELTHVFMFDVVPRGLIGADLPLWVDEGMANYMAGYWNPLDLMAVRDAALTDSVPSMSEFYVPSLSGRLPYSLGHAAFEFIEARWGQEGVRNFLVGLRRNVLGGNETAYEEALKLEADEFDDQFDRYLKERFKPFRDKERPADYGRDLAPDPERGGPFVSVLSIEPSPSGEMLAAVVGNLRDFEVDIVLLSALDGRVIRNLTSGFDKDRGFEYIAMSGGLRGNLVPWIAWAPIGDSIAYFARTDDFKTLIIQNIVTRETEYRLKIDMLDAPESPVFSPDGRTVAFAALSDGVADLYTVELATGAIKNLTNDTIADYAPAFSPDGRTMVYTARVSGNDKLFRLDLASGQKTQLTFGSHDDTAARFYDNATLVFTSTATDPRADIPIEVQANGNIPNVWTLNFGTAELRQLTDTMTGNVSPVVIRQSDGLRVGFVSYYKGENGIHLITPEKPIATVATSDFGSPGPIFDFTVPVSHTLLRDNIHKKGRFEKMRLAGRPPVGLGVTNSGNFYGNTQVTFTDVLGDKEVSFIAASQAQYRTTAFTYLNLGNRMQYALQGFSSSSFYFGQGLAGTGAFYDPFLDPFIDRDQAEAVRTQRGGTAFAIYPFSRYSRIELFSGYVYLSESYRNANLQQIADEFQERTGSRLFRNGHMMPFGLSFVKETTIFRDYGPVAGSTFKLSYDASPGFGEGWLSRQTIDADARYYYRIVANGVLATRLRAFKSWGGQPDLFSYGGNSEMRGYEYLQFIGQQAFFANAELRFPLIEAMLTPLGVLGGLRGAFFANLGASGFNNQPFKLLTRSTDTFQPLVGYQADGLEVVPILGAPVAVSGLRLIDGRASYGFGLQSFMLGFPMHFDWSWRTLLNRQWEDLLFRSCNQTGAEIVCTPDGGSFRKMQFDFWIGYDF